jgi:3-deoxy-manno-octulosonate cytidylyltransferase (CMP-KDO synthetase)
VPRKILGVIPARFGSSRFPGKVLAPLASKTVLEHVFERASQARYLTCTLIATDDERIHQAASAFGAPVRMTRSDHISGTDRVAEVASAENAEIIVNIQGDEPFIDPAAIDAAVLPLLHEPGTRMSTLMKKIEDPREAQDPNVVKVVTNREGDAIYFSRCPIPYHRDPRVPADAYYKHIGLYVYRRDFLLSYSSLPVGPLETAERLEQLRALENGYSIRVVETEYESWGVDTPEDLQRLQELVARASGTAHAPRERDGADSGRPRVVREKPAVAAPAIAGSRKTGAQAGRPAPRGRAHREVRERSNG